MSSPSTRFFDELAKVMTNAAGAAQGVRREVDTLIKAQVERVLGDLDVVQREEFEALREMAQKAREENEALKKRLDALAPAGAKKPASSPKKPAAKPKKTAASRKKPAPAKKPNSRKVASPKV